MQRTALVVGVSGTVQPLEPVLANDAGLWREIAQRHGLSEPALDRLASAWHTDLDLGRPIEVRTDMALRAYGVSTPPRPLAAVRRELAQRGAAG